MGKKCKKLRPGSVNESFTAPEVKDGATTPQRLFTPNAEPADAIKNYRPLIDGEISCAETKNRYPKPYTLMSEVRAKKPEWLWQPYVPLGELTIIDADPGTNKSTFTLDLAARVSRGWAMPTEKKKSRRGGVILLAAEDSVEKTIWPRLEAAGPQRRQSLGERSSGPRKSWEWFHDERVGGQAVFASGYCPSTRTTTRRPPNKSLACYEPVIVTSS